MAQMLTERYRERLVGVLSCYDRVVITGTLPGACYAQGMTSFLYARGIRIFDYARFAEPLRDRIRAAAVESATVASVTIQHINKPHIRKEDVVAKVLAERGDHPGAGARDLGHGSVRELPAVARQAEWQNVSQAGLGQVSALLLLLHRREVGAVLPAGAYLVPVPAAVLLQWPCVACPQARRRGHRDHPGRQRVRAGGRHRPGAGARRCAQTR